MAVEKAALALDTCVTSAACRAALDTTVEKFAQAIEAGKPENIRRKFKNAILDINIDPMIVATPVANGNGSTRTAKSKSRK